MINSYGKSATCTHLLVAGCSFCRRLCCCRCEGPLLKSRQLMCACGNGLAATCVIENAHLSLSRTKTPTQSLSSQCFERVFGMDRQRPTLPFPNLQLGFTWALMWCCDHCCSLAAATACQCSTAPGSKPTLRTSTSGYCCRTVSTSSVKASRKAAAPAGGWAAARDVMYCTAHTCRDARGRSCRWARSAGIAESTAQQQE